jgi:iron complex transport system ATP-binding protein
MTAPARRPPRPPVPRAGAHAGAGPGAAGDAPAAPAAPGGLAVDGLDVELDGTPVLSGVRLTAPGGSWLAVIGPNGAGKSTLLKAILGLVPYRGTVLVDGEPAHARGLRERARLIAYAPQTPSLPPDMTVFEYALLGRTPYLSYLGWESRADREIAAAVLDRLGLGPLARRRLGRLSGGERQRVVLARALTQQAPILLLDEPTTALDLGHQQQVLELVDHLRIADGLTVVTTLHDLSLAGQYADTVLLLSQGRSVASGPPAEVLTEASLAEHFGARVRVDAGPGGRPLVHLVRPAADRDR